MICQMCREPIDHQMGDMNVVVRCLGNRIRMVFCLKCADELILSKVDDDSE